MLLYQKDYIKCKIEKNNKEYTRKNVFFFSEEHLWIYMILGTKMSFNVRVFWIFWNFHLKCPFFLISGILQAFDTKFREFSFRKVPKMSTIFGKHIWPKNPRIIVNFWTKDGLISLTKGG